MKKSLVLAALIAASIASANNMKFTGLNGSVNGTINGEHVGVGLLNFHFDSGPDQGLFCSDLTGHISNGDSFPYHTVNTSTESLGFQIAGRILALEYVGATTVDQKAALQVALWEAVYDGADNGALPNFSAGHAIVNSLDSDQAAILTLATAFYEDGYAATSGSAVHYIADTNADFPHGQDQLGYQAVPEPTSLLALGLGALALVRRRK